MARGAIAPAPASTLAPGAAPVGFVPTTVQFGSVVPVVTETGFVQLSVDGIGMLDEEGVVQIEKPAGATVRRAFLAAASTGMSGRMLADGDVSVEGEPVSWFISTPSSINSWNHWAEVTSLVAPRLDAAEPGPVEVTIGEVDSAGIDGEILAVIFDTAERASVSTAVLLFGAQQVQGDTFNVRLSDPVDLDNPDYRLELSLGIGYGFVEQQYFLQRSLVDVNGQRMTSSAGGFDDGLAANGALLTVGGVGDSPDNPPPDELAPDAPGNSRFDDELYDLRPFTQTGDTELSVLTVNPSNDDNIFFSALFATGAAVIGEGLLLAPASARAAIGSSHTLTASVQNDVGDAVVGRDVTFTILAGPNAGETALLSTDAEGDATLEYVGDDGPGVDEIQASFVDSRGVTQFSSVALMEWFAVDQPPIAACTDVVKPVGDGCTADVQAAEVGAGSSDPDGDPLAFALAPTGPFTLGETAVTLTVTDNSGLAASCDARVTAIDTTPPVIACNAPEVASGAATVTATASDACADAVTVEITDYRCSNTGGSGQHGSSDSACPVSVDGPSLVIDESTCASGSIGSIEWTVRAVDASGNESTQDCQVSVDARGDQHTGHRHEKEHRGHGRHGRRQHRN
ncbi:MAG TPA: hypothetical protein VMG12_03770 [Polyangiaceae bacterium]|nr:hypothetical protein [Polyangiaceae bacterium]